MDLSIIPIKRISLCTALLFWCLQNSARRFINSTFNWLVWSKNKFTSEIEHLNMSIDTEMTWAYPDTSSDRIILYDLYKINYSWPINGTLAGHWTLKGGTFFSLTQYKYSRRQDLRGIVYNAALVVSRPLLHPLNFCLNFICTSCTRVYEHYFPLTLILRRSRTGTVWFYTSTSKRAARPKLYTKSLTRDLKRMYSRFTLVRISIKL